MEGQRSLLTNNRTWWKSLQVLVFLQQTDLGGEFIRSGKIFHVTGPGRCSYPSQILLIRMTNPKNSTCESLPLPLYVYESLTLSDSTARIRIATPPKLYVCKSLPPTRLYVASHYPLPDSTWKQSQHVWNHYSGCLGTMDSLSCSYKWFRYLSL